jgi:uncharacterized damage-inducible protein DinB
MAHSDPLTILVETNSWATRNLIETCRPLSHDQFHKKFEMGLGSLHATITHILGAMRGWGDMLAGREQRERLEAGGERTADQLLELFEEIDRDFRAAANAHPVDGVATSERGGKSYSFTRGGVLTHVTTHGMHHRAQCLNMLRQLGVERLPQSAVVEWMRFVDGAMEPVS